MYMCLDDKTRAMLSDPAGNYEKRRAWVIFQLKLRGKSLAALATECGVARQQAQKAMAIPYPRMEKQIAEALGLAPEELFPERYRADGRPNRKRGRPGKNLVSCHPGV